MARTALVLFTLLATFAEGADWPRWLGPHGDSSWRETGLIQTFPKEGPKVLWRVPAGHGYAGPAVAGDRVILADYVIREGTVDANPGARTTIQGDLRIRSLDAATGKEQWSHSRDQPLALSFPNGPRCTPTIDGDKVYYLGPEGLLVCLSLADGKPVWELDLKQTYSVPSPIWGFAAHPLIHGDLLYCLPGGPGTTAVALDKKTGKEVWRSLTAAEPGYAPPVIIQHGGVEQLIVWHPEAITSLHPLTGKQYWSVPFEPAYGMSIMAPRLAGDLLFIGAIQKQIHASHAQR